MPKINACVASTKRGKFMSSFGPVFLRHEMLKIWKSKMLIVLE